MNCVLTRFRFLDTGIFGVLKDEAGGVLAYTLEHNFGGQPKLAVGTYTCQRGSHILKGMSFPFITFEILGVPPFQGSPVTGILFHCGNFNADSEGCVLMGSADAPDFSMVTGSRADFSAFLNVQEGVDEFILIVQ